MHTLPDALMLPLSELLAAQMGLHFPEERWGDLERGMAAAASEFGMADVDAYVRWLLSATLTHQQLEILAGNLTIGETYFFRDPKSFEALEQHVLPELIRSRGSERRLRIWSAGCCTGEEPYSIAMLLDRLLPDRERWNITILGTDINPRFLRKAAAGIYGEWSFRNVPAWIKERYFRKGHSGRFEIDPRIKRMVTFSYLNLAEDAYPSLLNNTNAMDIIFCRNVLMYFTPERIKKVAVNLHRALVKDGWLLVSSVETSRSMFENFSHVNFPDSILYRKGMEKGLSGDAWQYPDNGEASAPATISRTAPELLRKSDLLLPIFPRKLKAKPATDKRARLRDPPPAQDTNDEPCIVARSYANQGKLANAVEWCEKAIAMDKLNPEGHYLLASIRQEMGHPDLAEQSLKRVLYLDPDYIPAHFAMGNLHLSQGSYAEAARSFRNSMALLKAHPHDEILAQSEGLTAGRLAEIVTSVMASLPHAAELRA